MAPSYMRRAELDDGRSEGYTRPPKVCCIILELRFVGFMLLCPRAGDIAETRVLVGACAEVEVDNCPRESTRVYDLDI